MGVSSALLGDQVLGKAAQRRVGIVAQLRAGNVRNGGVKQRGQRTQNARLRLPAQAEQDEVVPREHGVYDLRHDGVVVADDAGEERFFRLRGRAQARNQVVAELVFDRAADTGRAEFRFAEGAEGSGQCGSRHI